jgi:hypothetical protein
MGHTRSLLLTDGMSEAARSETFLFLFISRKLIFLPPSTMGLYDTRYNRCEHKIERVRVLGINTVADAFVPIEGNRHAGGPGT